MKICFFYISVVSFVLFSCKKEVAPEPYPLNIFKNIEFSLLSINPISNIDSINILPWADWDLETFRPDTAFEIFFQNHNRQQIKVVFMRFAEDYLAYGLFNRYAGYQSTQGYFYLSREVVVLYNRDFVCSLHLPPGESWNTLKLSEFQKILDPNYAMPKIFNSFPLQNRIAHSEWVQPRYFLGIDNIGETVGVKYPCLLEQAHLFRTIDINSHEKLQAYSTDFQGKIRPKEPNSRFLWGKTEFGEPIYILTQKWGFLGILGCSDSLRVESLLKKAEKMNGLMP